MLWRVLVQSIPNQHVVHFFYYSNVHQVSGLFGLLDCIQRYIEKYTKAWYQKAKRKYCYYCEDSDYGHHPSSGVLYILSELKQCHHTLYFPFHWIFEQWSIWHGVVPFNFVEKFLTRPWFLWMKNIFPTPNCQDCKRSAHFQGESSKEGKRLQWRTTSVLF